MYSNFNVQKSELIELFILLKKNNTKNQTISAFF